tara:strand:- start:82 stop:327 length:246 start_codon:yes stop_codon:yes gene_type:complete
MNNYSYQELAENGISVCASCGSANINLNKGVNNQNKNKTLDHCFDCDYAEGTALCMPDDLNFYQEAQATLNKIAKGNHETR